MVLAGVGQIGWALVLALHRVLRLQGSEAACPNPEMSQSQVVGHVARFQCSALQLIDCYEVPTPTTRRQPRAEKFVSRSLHCYCYTANLRYPAR